jgi:hypothetical protein
MIAVPMKDQRSRISQGFAALICLSVFVTPFASFAKKPSNKLLTKEAIFSKVAPASVLIVIPSKTGVIDSSLADTQSLVPRLT